jgi:mannose-1-phosphate guanylyltransferase
MYAFHPSVLDETPDGTPRDIGFDLLPRLVGRAQVVALDGGCYFRDIGSSAALELARNEWEGRTAS